jgi:hypothetical protein
MEAMRAHFEREAGLESPWTSYNASLGRPLLNTEKFLTPKKTVSHDVPHVEAIVESAEPAVDSDEQTSTLPGLQPRRQET